MLKVDGIQTFYGNIQALKGISFHVGAGEIVTLIGANGAGKSTTLMSVSGVYHPKKGSIMFQDVEIARSQPDAIVRMGISQVPEGRRIFPHLTVRENLLLGSYIRKDSEGVKESLEMVFELFPVMKERRNQDGGTLSGGEQQMLAIGRALMANPKLFLLDEPSLGLAPIVVEKIFTVIQEINKRSEERRVGKECRSRWSP